MAVMGIDPYSPVPPPAAYAFVRLPEEQPPAETPPEERPRQDVDEPANPPPLEEEQGRSVDTYA
jgi:hypothetical protein